MLQNLEDYLDKEHKVLDCLDQQILRVQVEPHFLVVINKLVESDFLESN